MKPFMQPHIKSFIKVLTKTHVKPHDRTLCCMRSRTWNRQESASGKGVPVKTLGRASFVPVENAQGDEYEYPVVKVIDDCKLQVRGEALHPHTPTHTPPLTLSRKPYPYP